MRAADLDALWDFDRPARSEQPKDGYVDEELGELLLALGGGGEAGPHFARAHALLSADSWLAEAEPARLARLADLATPSH